MSPQPITPRNDYGFPTDAQVIGAGYVPRPASQHQYLGQASQQLGVSIDTLHTIMAGLMRLSRKLAARQPCPVAITTTSSRDTHGFVIDGPLIGDYSWLHQANQPCAASEGGLLSVSLTVASPMQLRRAIAQTFGGHQ